MLGNPAPSCVSCCCRLWWWCCFPWLGGWPSVFRKTSREKKISRGNWINIPLLTLAHPAPIIAKTPGHDLEPLNVLDGCWSFSKWFNKAQPWKWPAQHIFLLCLKQNQTRKGAYLNASTFRGITHTSQCTILWKIPTVCHFRRHDCIKALCTPGALRCLQHKPLISHVSKKVPHARCSQISCVLKDDVTSHHLSAELEY